MEKKYNSKFFTIIAFLSILLISEIYIYLKNENLKTQEQFFFQTKIEDVSQNFNSIVNTSFFLQNILNYLLNLKDFSDKDLKDFFQNYMENVFDKIPFVYSAAISRNSKLFTCYPCDKKNEDALNKDFSLIEQTLSPLTTIEPLFYDFTENYEKNKNITLSVSLKKDSKFWGSLNLIMNVPDFLHNSNIDAINKEKISYAFLNHQKKILLGNELLANNGIGEIYSINTASTKPFYIKVFKENDGTLQDISLRIISIIVGFIFAFLTKMIFDLKNSENKNILYDRLTKLPRANLFFAILDNHIWHARRERSTFGIIYVHISGIGLVNRRFSEKVGDFVLQESAKRIAAILRRSDVISRIEGSEFAILVKNSKSTGSLDKVEEKLKSCLKAPLVFGQESIELKIKMGLVFYPKDSQDTVELVKLAKMDMKRNS